MAILIKHPKNFWTGIIYLLFGGLAFWFARDYGMGSATRMGPGYFPIVLSCLLMFFGAITVVRSFILPGEPIGKFAFKSSVLIIGATVLFGFLVIRAGLIIALLVLALMSAAASSQFKFEWTAAAGLLGLLLFCALVFVKGLGVQTPLLGIWFGS